MEKKEFKKYLIFNSVVGLGIANGLLTMLVFGFKSWKDKQYIYSGIELQKELLITSIIIGITVTFISNLFTKRDIKKEKIKVQQGKHIVSELIPSTKPFRVIYSTAYSFLAAYLITVLVVLFSKQIKLSLAASLVVIFIISTISSSITAYINIIKTAYESINLQK